ncbi:hypothetical protein SLS60_011643 [Paraconiothyrium brasiliense]|uniref:NmrA-like domain-containing protein n=1 Tax=Paraconiothyrium brasiliense TaxID=300254 RepID=A0ABR3QHL3_9PLEO
MLGGAVISHLLTLPHAPYHILALTRNPTSPAALKLSASGVEVTHADLDDAPSLEAALRNVHAVFLVTDFWSCPSPGASREIAQAKRVLDILSRSPSLEHLIYSSLPSVREASQGRYQAVVHFDGKADVVQWLKETHEGLWGKTTVLWVGTYMQLWKQFRAIFAPAAKVIEGKEVWVQSSVFHPESRLPLVDVRDVGKAVSSILGDAEGLKGRTVSLVAPEQVTMKEQLDVWGRLVGKEVAFRHISEEESWEGIKELGFEEFLAKDVWETGVAFRECEGRLLHGDAVVQVSEVRD